jgi:hypothetical protein
MRLNVVVHGGNTARGYGESWKCGHLNEVDAAAYGYIKPYLDYMPGLPQPDRADGEPELEEDDAERISM